MHNGKYPADWRPSCSCSAIADDPDDYCPYHGGMMDPACPYCGQFRGRSKPCKRCGCTWGIVEEEA